MSAVNYSSAQAAVEMAKSVSTKRPHEADYRDVGIIGIDINALNADGTYMCTRPSVPQRG